MHILYLVNAKDSSPGVLLDEASRQGADATLILTTDKLDMATGDRRDVPETPDDFDANIVLDGAMSVYEDAQYPFMERTRALLRRFHEAEKPVMGVCLGAQFGKMFDSLGQTIADHPSAQADALEAGRSVEHVDGREAAFETFEDRMAAFRANKANDALPTDLMSRIFSLAFAVRQVKADLADLDDRIDEFGGTPQ